MKQLCLLPIVLLFGICISISDAAAEPANLGLQKIELEHYYDSGQYDEDLTTRLSEAKYYLNFRITQNGRLKNPKKLALVLDIDETALSNYDDLRRLQFGGTAEEIEAANVDGHDSAIDPTLDLYRFALENNIAIFFITGRKEFERSATIENLLHAGYQKWSGLLMQPDNYNRYSITSYKVASREKIEEMGYDIVLNIGDQYSDLRGSHADMTIKLPNPFYYIP